MYTYNMYLLENDSYISLIEENEEDPVSVMDLCIKENDNKILEKIEIFICVFVLMPILILPYIFKIYY